MSILSGEKAVEEIPSIEYCSVKTQSMPGGSEAIDYVKFITEKLINKGYKITYQEVGNLLICIEQSFLSIISGQSGTGKTSGVINVVESMGLVEEGKARSSHFLNIPVSRGWMSSRDFIGFYNSLKGIYQPSKTGMYQFLKGLNEKESGDVLSVVLLDEANLSPIEHYWSDFLALCDAESKGRGIETGSLLSSERTLDLPENLRFVATVNNDETTEQLSQRLIDRAPVIKILEITDEEVLSDIQMEHAINYSDFHKLFNVDKDDIIGESQFVNRFLDLMTNNAKDCGKPIMISPRKRAAINNYIFVAEKIMGVNLAADFALSQFVLPLINGHGDAFRTRLNKLLEQAGTREFKRTSLILEQIISDGEELIDSYSFF